MTLLTSDHITLSVTYVSFLLYYQVSRLEGLSFQRNISFGKLSRSLTVILVTITAHIHAKVYQARGILYTLPSKNRES